MADGATPSHLHATSKHAAPASAVGRTDEESEGSDTRDVVVAASPATAVWLPPAEAELRKIPFFVRGKARRNTERYAVDHGITQITVDTLYDAKAHYGR